MAWLIKHQEIEERLLYCVGYFDLDLKHFVTIYKFKSLAEASKMVHYLNGGSGVLNFNSDNRLGVYD